MIEASLGSEISIKCSSRSCMLLRAFTYQKRFEQLYHLVPLQLRGDSVIQLRTELKSVQSHYRG